MKPPHGRDNAVQGAQDWTPLQFSVERNHWLSETGNSAVTAQTPLTVESLAKVFNPMHPQAKGIAQREILAV